MKKIFALVLLFITLQSQAQYPVTSTMGSPSTLIKSKGGLGADSSFNFITSYSDTTALNRGFIKNMAGALVRVGDNLYLRSALADRWILLGSSSGGVNIYNSDGTLTGHRTVSGGSNQLDFTGFSDFNISSNGGLGVSYSDGVYGSVSMTHNTGAVGFDISHLASAQSSTINFGTGFLNLATDNSYARVDQTDIKLSTASLQLLNIPRLGQSGKRVLVKDTTTNQVSEVSIDSLGGGGTQTLQSVTTNGDSTSNRIVTIDSIKGLNSALNGSLKVGDTLPGTKTAIFWGNSVTAGFNLPSPTTQRFPALVSHNFGWNELNRGISGTRLTFNFAGDSSMIDRLYVIPTYSATTYSVMFFDYGLNDDQAGVDTTTFKTAYARVIDTCTARGWPLSKIYLISPNYNTYSLTPHTANFAIAIRTIAGVKGVNFVDDYTYTLTHGARTLLQSDSLHPNVLGADVMRQGISETIKNTYKRVGDLVVTGTSTFNGYIQIPSSSTLTSGISATDDTNTGFAINSGNVDQAAIFNGGVPSLAFTRNFMQGDANWQYAWTTGSSGGFAGGPDAGIAKQGAAALRVSNGSTGYGSMAVSALKTHGTTSGDVTVQSSTGTWTMTLPTSAGASGYVLQTDGSGVTSWVAQSGGSGSGTNLYVRINKTLSDSLLYAPNDSTLVGKSIDVVSSDSTIKVTKTITDSTLKYSLTLRTDTCALASFAGGGANAGDTTAFTTSTIYGSFFNSFSDTLVITNLRIGLQGTSPSVGVTVYWNDSLAVTAGATKLVNAGTTATNIYTGTSVTSFDNTKIPPGVWVWVQTTAVTTKPTYMTATLIGYKKRVQ